MSVGDDSCTVPRLDFELSAACDHKCAHCYNVWNASPGDAQAGYDVRGQLKTPALLDMMTKAVRQSGATHVTLTGGEPLLRKDAMAVVAHAASLVPSLTLITNGSHVTPEVARQLAALGIRGVQLTLLAGHRDLHDRLKGAVCFDDTVRAALDLTEAGVHAQVCYVAMRENAGQLGPVLELCAALGVRSMSYNRMSPTGWAIHHIERLLPTVEDIERDLDTAETLGRRYGIAIATAMPILPCLIRIDRYRWVRFGFCSTGSDSPNVVVDGKGNVRSCNLSSKVLGNLVEQDWAEVFAHPYPRAFKHTVPDLCRGCAFETTCQGGCKESAHATFGDHTHPEPLLWTALDPTHRGALRLPDQAPPPPRDARPLR